MNGSATAIGGRPDRYKWIALSNTTLSMTMATIDASIVIIAMPAIFRGIGLNPLAPGNISYLLWMIIGYLLVQSVCVVTLGRLGDMFGRVKIYNLGFVVFTLASIALSLDPLTGTDGAMWLIGWRFVQAFGGAMLMANSAAILTDAFPANKRGMALGINQIAGISGQFVGLLLGGLLAAVGLAPGVLGERADRAVRHGVGVQEPARDRDHQAGEDRLGRERHVRAGPGRAAGRHHLRDPALRRAPDRVDQPVDHRRAGRRRRDARRVLHLRDEDRRADVPDEPVQDPGLRGGQRWPACSARSPAAGCSSCWSSGWPGIWLPLHGYDFAVTPLWAGIYMLPLTAGFLIAGPISGTLSDRYGQRPFATAGPAAGRALLRAG